MDSNHSRNQSLDGLRGIAAIYVIFFHIFVNTPWYNTYSKFFQSLIYSGATMVQVFFVISGYCIALSARSLFRSHANPVKAFLVRRFFRIMPLWIVLLLYMRWKQQIQTDVMLGNLFFYFGEMRFGDRWFPVVPAWSLQSEVIFYLLSAVFLKQLISLSWQATLKIYLVALFVSSLWGLLGAQVFQLHQNFVYCIFPYQLHFFISGMLLYFIVESGFHLKKYFNFQTITLFEIIIISFFLMQKMYYFDSIKIALLAPAVVLMVLQNETWIRTILTSKACQVLGKASFGIYILQDQARLVAQKISESLPFPASVGIQISFCILFGIIGYYLIERPMIRWSKKF